MAVLPEEPCRWPGDLFAWDDRTGPFPNAWWVLHTRPRCEKMVSREMFQREIGFFIPLYKRRKRLQRRQVVSHLPLFPGYVFLYGDDDQRHRVLQTRLVAHCLPVEDQTRLHAELSQIHRLMEADLPLAPEDRLQPGMKAEIVGGALAGFSGKIIRRQNSFRLLVEVQLLQRGVSVEVETSMIRPAV